MNIWMMLFQVFNSVSAIYIYCLFFGTFSEKREFKLRNLALIGLAIIWTTVLTFMPVSTIRMIIILSLIVVLSFMYHNDWYKNLLLSILIFCFPGILEVLVGTCFSLFGVGASQINQSVNLVVGALISKLLTITCVKFIQYGRHKFESIHKSYYIAFTMMAIGSTLIATLILDYLFMNTRSHMKIVAIVSLCMLLTADIVIFYVIDKINALNITKHNLALSKLILKEQKQHYEIALKEQEHLAKTRHDIKNFLIGVLAEFNSGNQSNAKHILENMLYDISDSNAQTICHDSVLNTILTIKMKEALQHEINFIHEEHIIGKIKTDPTDLCVIIGNVLDNAIDACKNISDKKEILFFISSSGSNLIIQVKNSVNEKINTVNLTTSKPNKILHGFGLPRIRELIEKYEGSIDLSCDDEYFETIIVLVNE